MINLKEHIKLTGVYTFFAAFPAILQLIVYPIIEGKDRLGAEDFGYLAIAEAIVSFVTLFCVFGMNSGISRFFYDDNKVKSDYKSLISTVFIGVLFRGFLVLILFFFFSDFLGSFFIGSPLQNFNEYGTSLGVAGINRALIGVAIALFRQEKRIKAFAIVTLFSGVFRASFQILGIFYFDMSFIGYFKGAAIGGGIVSVFLLVFLFMASGFSFNLKKSKELRNFSSPIFISEFLFWGILFADRFFLLNRPDQLGIYDNALKLAIGMQFIIQGLSGAIQPEIFKFLSLGLKKHEIDVKKLSNLFIAESIAVVAFAIIPAMLFINFFFETSLTISASIICIVFSKYILMSQYYVFAFPVLYSKKTKSFIYVSLAMLTINIVLNYFLVPIFGYYGSIIAFLSAFIFQVITFRIIQNKIMPIKWNLRKVFFFPLILVFLAVCLEISKVVTDINHFITSSVFSGSAILGLFILYRKEIYDSYKKILTMTLTKKHINDNN